MCAAAVRGYVDGLEGSYVVGWAVNDSGSPCTVSIRDPKNKVLATGIASIERGDLVTVANGRCDLAFRIPLPSLGMAKKLHVWADGVEISQAPIPLGSGLFDGFISIGASHIEGWVAERVANFAAPLITAVDQSGKVVMSCQSRRDEAPGDAWFSPARFRGDFDESCFGRGELLLDICANGVKFAEGKCNLPLYGFLETVAADRCAGWLLSPNAPDKAFTIEVWRDGKPIARTKTDIPRKDVQSAHPACRRSGFDVVLPPDPSDPRGLTTLSLRFADSPRELFEGPYVVGNRAALVRSAREASRLALNAAPDALDPGGRAVLQAALADFLSRARATDVLKFTKQMFPAENAATGTRLNIIIPIYRGAKVTQACIESALATRSAEDRIVLIDDCSPDADMPGVLKRFDSEKNLFLLRNEQNQGFVRSVNRGLSFCGEGDALLLNSDTRIFPGVLDELWQVLHAAPDIGTVTAISNNATIFSYPHFLARGEKIDDISWEELAEIALQRNRGKAIDVPTGHGFCLLIRREVLNRVGQLDETFGRGYGEENDLCARAADLGYRNVAAPGAFVEHREGVSFGDDKADLLSRNLRILDGRYPEYTATIMETERRDDLRAARWALDAARFERACAAGRRFALLACHRLGGGTNKAIDDIEATVGYGQAEKITLICRADGFLELVCEAPTVRALFSNDETADLLQLLSAAQVNLVVVHQALGFSAKVLTDLGAWLKDRHAIFYAHDFYPICARVTMINAVNRFCELAAPDVCKRCVAAGGAHEASRLFEVKAEDHRAFFGAFLANFKHVVAPSENAATYYRSAFPGLAVDVVSHPAAATPFPAQPRSGNDDEIVLFGAIGPHKGSAELLAIAHVARLTHPHLSFRVIGYTDIDDALTDMGNVTITGAYRPQDLPELIAATRGRLALFLQGWPETFSYTLTEAVQNGFIPLVPAIGAPADRVAAAGYGAVFDFPVSPTGVLNLITDIASGKRKPVKRNAAPSAFAPDPKSIERTRAIFGIPNEDADAKEMPDSYSLSSSAMTRFT